jgi:heme a synthase
MSETASPNPESTASTEPTVPLTPGRVPRWTHWVLVVNVIVQAGILVTGAVVRVTSSGLGCPTWPTCTGSSWFPVAHQKQGWHKYVEYTNRDLTFVLVAVAALAFVAVWWHVRSTQPKRRALFWLGTVPIIGTVLQAILGGITVLLKLNPWTVSAHFLLSIALVYVAVVLQYRADEDGDGPISLTVHPAVRKAAWAVTGVGALVILLGVVTTGSGPHSGDAIAARFPLDQRVVAWFHADIVLLFVGLFLGVLLALYVTNAPALAKQRAWYVVIMVGVQATIGYTQWFTGLPEALVIMHVAGAATLWVLLVRFLLTTRTRTTAALPA